MTSEAEQRAKARERQRRYRQRQREQQAAEVVRQLPDRDDDGPGPTVTAVTVELGRLSGAANRPGLAASALRLAELLDDPTAAPQKPAAARALRELLDELAQGARVGGKLAELRAARDAGRD